MALPGSMVVRGSSTAALAELVRALRASAMLTIPSALKIYLAVEPVDMRKSFNGLRSLAEQKLGEIPRQDAVKATPSNDTGECKVEHGRPIKTEHPKATFQKTGRKFRGIQDSN